MKERIGFLAMIVLVVALAMAAGRCEGSIEDCIDATCKISDGAGKPLGTGTAYRRAGGQIMVMTNAHVVEGLDAVACEFWKRGHQSRPLPGRVVRRVRNNECDGAIVAIDEGQFAEFLPSVIPLASADYVIRPGETVVSVGCAGGAWATAWKGHAKGYLGTDLRFLPAPAGGRSGSAIFDADGTRIVGLLYARTSDDSEGMAVSLQALYKHLKTTSGAGTPSPASRNLCGGVWAPCQGGSQCPNGQCPPQRPNRQIQLFGRQEYQGSPYPSLPVPPPVPEPRDYAPLVPVAPVDTQARARLDVLERQVAGLKGTAEVAAQKAEVVAGTVKTETAGAKQEVEGLKTKLKETLEEVGGIRGVIDKVKGGEIEGIRAVVKAVLFSYGWWGVGIGGIVGYFIWDLYRKVKTGDPLLIEKIRERLHERAAPVRAAVRERLQKRFGDDDDDDLPSRLLARLDRIEARLHPPATTGGTPASTGATP